MTGWSAVAYFADATARHAPPQRAAPLVREADAALARALALDPEDSRVWHVKVYRVPPTDLVATDRAFQRALKARLSLCACVFQDYANFLRGVGRAHDARQMLERAQDVIPLQIGPRAGLIQLDAADGRIAVTRKELAEVDALGLNPVRSAQFFLSSSLWLKDYRGALSAMQQQPASGPQAFSDAVTAGFRALQVGDPAARAAAARTLAAAAATCGCTSSFSIRMQAALGDAPGALAQIEAQVAKGKIAPILSTIGWDPVLADVRRLPGFAPLTERVGLIRYWRTTRTRPDFCTAAGPPPVCATI